MYFVVVNEHRTFFVLKQVFDIFDILFYFLIIIFLLHFLHFFNFIITMTYMYTFVNFICIYDVIFVINFLVTREESHVKEEHLWTNDESSFFTFIINILINTDDCNDTLLILIFDRIWKHDWKYNQFLLDFFYCLLFFNCNCAVLSHVGCLCNYMPVEKSKK